MKAWALFIPSLALLGACVQNSGIDVPPATLADTQQLDLVGLGGWQDGRFQLGQSEGRFSRRAGQQRFGSRVRNTGGASFAASGPELGDNVRGRCTFDEQELDLGIAALPDGRLSYRCRLESDRGQGGDLFLAEVPHGTGLLAGRTRAGEVRFADMRLEIQPIHHFRGGRIPAGSPIGYSFHRDGRQVGAVDLTDPKRRIHAPLQPGAERDAVLLGGLALSLFWDPGE